MIIVVIVGEMVTTITTHINNNEIKKSSKNECKNKYLNTKNTSKILKTNVNTIYSPALLSTVPTTKTACVRDVEGCAVMMSF